MVGSCFILNQQEDNLTLFPMIPKLDASPIGGLSCPNLGWLNHVFQLQYSDNHLFSVFGMLIVFAFEHRTQQDAKLN